MTNVLQKHGEPAASTSLMRSGFTPKSSFAHFTLVPLGFPLLSGFSFHLHENNLQCCLSNLDLCYLHCSAPPALHFSLPHSLTCSFIFFIIKQILPNDYCKPSIVSLDSLLAETKVLLDFAEAATPASSVFTPPSTFQ